MLFKINDDKVKQLKVSSFKNEKQLQTLFENNLEEILGCKFVASEYSTTNAGRIDTLAIDENGNPVVIEYKEKKSQSIVNQGLFYLSWILDHKGDFEKEVRKRHKKIKIEWSQPRLILIAKNYSKFDLFTIGFISPSIELKKYELYESGILLLEDVEIPAQAKKATSKLKPITNKLKKEIKEYDLDHFFKTFKQSKKLFSYLKERLLEEIDENSKEVIRKYYIAYYPKDSTKSYTEIVPQKQGIKIYIRPKIKELPKTKLKLNDCSKVGHWTNGNTYFFVNSEEKINEAISIIKYAYNQVK